jgi:hypothetical protein
LNLDAPLLRCSRAALLGMAGVTALFLGACWLSFDQIEEDAFIFFRVAENLADGEGFTFNRGEAPIECSSSLTYQLLLVALPLLSLDPIVPSKLLGIALGALALWLSYWLARRLLGDPRLAVLPPLLLAVSIPFHQWSQRGLETPLYACTLLAAVSCALHPRLSRFWYLPAFAIVCTRPEGLFLALGLVLILACLPARREIEAFPRGLGIFVLLCALLLGLRLLYFHDFVPNPFYTKFHGSSALGWRAFLTHALSGGGIWIGLPALLTILALRRWSQEAFLIAGMAVCTTLWAIVGEDWKPYNRHLVPALPFVALLAVYPLRLLPRRPLVQVLAASYFVGASLWILLAARAVYDFSETWPNPLVHSAEAPADPRARTPASERIGSNRHAAVGKFLRLNYPQGITIVFDQMGQTPWYAGRDKVFVDTLGLVNREVGVGLFRARNRGGALGLYANLSHAVLSTLWPGERRSLAGVGIVDYFFERNAHLMLFHEDLLGMPNSVPARLFRDPRLTQRYRQRFLVAESVRVLEREGFAARADFEVPEGCTVVEL